MAEKFPAPTPKRRIKPRPHIKGALGVKHPLEALTDDARRGEWDEMTGHHHPGIFIGTRRAPRGVAVDNRHRATSLGKVPSAAKPNDAAANDENVVRFVGHVSGNKRCRGGRDRLGG